MLEDGIDLAVSVDSVINDAESGSVEVTLSGVDSDINVVSVTLSQRDLRRRDRIGWSQRGRRRCFSGIGHELVGR